MVFLIACTGLGNYADSSLEYRCHLQGLEETNAVMGQADSKDEGEVVEVAMTAAVEGTGPISSRSSRMKTCCSVFSCFCFFSFWTGEYIDIVCSWLSSYA